MIKTDAVCVIKKRLIVGLFIIFCGLIGAEFNRPQEDLFLQATVYTVINNTQEPVDITWQSGGGSGYDVLTGKEGSLHISPNTSPSHKATIITSGTDCIDFITVKSNSSAATLEYKKAICGKTITIEFDGDPRQLTLALKIE